MPHNKGYSGVAFSGIYLSSSLLLLSLIDIKFSDTSIVSVKSEKIINNSCSRRNVFVDIMHVLHTFEFQVCSRPSIDAKLSEPSAICTIATLNISSAYFREAVLAVSSVSHFGNHCVFGKKLCTVFDPTGMVCPFVPLACPRSGQDQPFFQAPEPCHG